MKRLAIFHYNPIELFPPAMNMISYLSESLGEDFEINVYTTAAGKGFKAFLPEESRNVRIYRRGGNSEGRAWIFRFSLYLWHYVFSMLHCLTRRPSHMLYIESVSGVVPLILKKYFMLRVPLFIHYHEYMSPVDYERSGILRRIHGMEKLVYPAANWISHTNEDRMEMFLKDLGKGRHQGPFRIMPNFPLRSWVGDHAKTKFSGEGILKLVYVGAVDLETMYLPEFINWVEQQQGRCTLDIMSNQDLSMVKKFLQDKGARHVRTGSSVPYFQLAGILKQFDVGVILYKDTYINFVHNAPNKLFEYLAVGLDVWYPTVMLGIKPYQRSHRHPLVKAINFDTLDDITIPFMITAETEGFEPTCFFAENVYSVLSGAIAGVE